MTDIEHVLTFVEDDDDQGYQDGLEDVYRCTCGATFQANGDIVEAFEHGQETAVAVTVVAVDGGVAYTATVLGKAETIHIDWDNLKPDAGNDHAAEEAQELLDQIEKLGVAKVKVRNRVNMPGIVTNLRKVVADA